MAKNNTTTELLVLLLGISFTASASSHHGGCDPHDPTQGCEQTEIYNESFTTTSFTEETFSNKYFFNFDAIQEPGDNFEITGATLTVTTNSNGWWDSIWIKDSFNFWHELGHLENTNVQSSQVFILEESFFDEILNGVDFKAWFSKSNELITSAELTVNGKYCPPPSAVPIPGAVWLFGSAFAGLIGFARRRREHS